MENESFRYDIEGLAKDMEVELSTLSTLYSEYFHEMKINIEESKTLANSEDWFRLERVIHNIKGISTSLNISDIYSFSNKLDVNLKNGKTDAAINDINTINELFNACENSVRQFFKEKEILI
jgi:HPt (histidine-containing phosphotransfer) domain-containing protein